MSSVRIRVSIAGLGLEFCGSRAFYERRIEPLVVAAYAKGAPGSEPLVVADDRAEDKPAAGVAVQAAGSEVSEPGPPASEPEPPASEPERRAESRSGEGTPHPDEAEDGGAKFHPREPARFNQFVRKVGKRAATIDQRIMAFSFYLWNYERQDEFASSEIESFFRTVLEEPPEDVYARISDLAERRRFLERAGESDWRLTTKGVNYVKNRLLGAA